MQMHAHVSTHQYPQHSQLTHTCTRVEERTVLDWCREDQLHTTMQSVYQRALSACDRRAFIHILLLCLSVVAMLRVRGTSHKSQVICTVSGGKLKSVSLWRCMTNAVHTRYTHIHTLVLSHNVWLVYMRHVSKHLPLKKGLEGITCWRRVN